MMKTRRKTKAQAAATQDTPSSTPEGSHPFTVQVPDDIDIDLFSTILPDVDLSNPSPEAIASLYRLVVAHVSDLNSTQRQLEELRSQADRKDVEIEQAVQDRDSVAHELTAQISRIQEELDQVKQERDQLVASRTALQTQVASLSTSQSSSSQEVEALKLRVEDTEREKRELIGVVDRLAQDQSSREEELVTLRANLKEARNEHQTLEAKVRELESTKSSTKYKIESLQEQLKLSKAEAKRDNDELTSKCEEFTAYRQTKHTKLVALQSSLDSLTQSHDLNKSTLKALQSAHTAQTHQLTQALVRVQDLTGQLAEQEVTYASEANTLKRLISMMEAREKQAKEVVENIEREWAEVGEKSERREAALRDEIERERQEKEVAEKRAEQLQSVLDRMGRGELPSPGQTGSPYTPRRSSDPADFLTQGMVGLSPTVAMVSRAQKTGKTFTDVYAEYVRLQEDFAKKSVEYDHMDRTLSAVLAQIEERAPILSQQRAEYERLQSEAAQLASELAQVLSDRDAHAKFAQETSQKLSKTERENDLLQKQLEDLGLQIQSLMRDIARRDDPTIPSDDILNEMAIAPAENMDTLITNNLVLFRSIGGLQTQNQKLLKIVRDLGAKLESEEKDYQEAMEKEQGEAVREAHEAIQELAGQLERQKKSSEITIQAYMKERDALRSMLNRAERGSASGDALPSGVNGDVNGYHPASGSGGRDVARELAEITSQFDAYKLEMGVDSTRLREEVVAAQREAAKLGAALAKANAKLEFLDERHRMNQEQIQAHANEMNKANERNQELRDQLTKLEFECSHATDNWQVANGRIEQLRNQCANLRAEKQIWEDVQSRLMEENRALAMERSQLSDLIGNVQKMHTDLELSGENERRRLDSQLKVLENQTQDLRAQVSQERASIRHISSQKDSELKELQSRLDNITQEHSKTREALVGAETSKKHLEDRIEELIRSLKGNEEKLAVYERRSSAVNGLAQDLNREQQLEAEVAELRSALKVAEVDLATARNHVQQFQEISQANEEALASLNATHDEYKAVTEAQIARHESELIALQQKLQTAEEELAQVTAKYSDLQRSFETERAAWLADKKTLEDTIVDMSTSEKHSESDRSSWESAVHRQEERAKAAEERYSHEVLAHAESINAIEGLKQQLSTVQTTARDNQTAAETAKAKLATSEYSWKQQKEALDKEVADLDKRCRDLASQNTILHQHLESVSSQATRIRQAANSSAPSAAGETGEDTDAKLSELRIVLSYLRTEKEIVDLKLEVKEQENLRLQAQVKHISHDLNEARKTLSEERERAVETAASASQHAELVDRINQLNLLRESNATLRADCDRYKKRSRELESQLKQLSSELEPAKEQARTAQAELEARDVQLKRLEDENRRWQERNTQLLSKYDRIDPAEVQALKDEIEQLKAQKVESENGDSERDERIIAQAERIALLETSVRNHKDAQARTTQGFKQRLGSLNAEKSQLSATVAELTVQIKSLTAERDALQKEKSTSDVESTANTQTSSDQALLISNLQKERDTLLAEKATWVISSASVGSTDSTTEEVKLAWEAEKAQLTKARDDLAIQAKTASEEAKRLAEEAKNVKMANEKFQARIQDLLKARASDGERAAAQQAAAVEKVKAELQTANASSSSPDEVTRRHAEELRHLEARLKAQHQAELEAALDAAKASSSTTSSNEDQKAVIAAAIAAHDRELQARHYEEIASAVERGRMEQAAKGKLKDSQLVKAQKKVKELEIQILEWRKAGIIPEAAAPASATVPPPTPTSSTAASAGPSSSTHVTPAAPAPAPTQSPAANAGLPRKPSMVLPTGPADGGAGRGRGGASRGGPSIRGAARGLNIRGAAPGRGGATSPTASTGGVSIMGAAKRPRDDSGDDSLAKRLKPADPISANASSGGKPVTLRRPPPST